MYTKMPRTTHRNIVLLVVPFLFFFFYQSIGQTYNWKRLRYEGYVGLGATNFMGDVGARINSGIYSYVWVNPQAIRPVLQLGGRYSLDTRQKLRVNMAVGLLGNEDRYGDYPQRFFQFRSPIVELGGIYEYYIIREQKKKTKYRWLNLHKRNRDKLVPTYIFAGVSAIYFNPQAYTRGKWHSLHPLHTEGQGLPGFAKHYSRFNVAFPVGIGVKFKISPYRSLGFEAGWRFTLTDYIDDVGSGRYPSTRTMLNNFGETAAILSHRYGGRTNYYDINFPGGPKRGGKWIDQYQFVTISYSAIFKTNRKGRPKLEFY